MAWTAPMTATAGAVFTAGQFNTYIRDNLLATETAKATAAGGHFVSTGANAIIRRAASVAQNSSSETTTSTTYTDLATVGPTVTVTTGTKAIVIISCAMSSSLGTGTAATAMAFEVSGSTSIAASDTSSWYQSGLITTSPNLPACAPGFLLTNLTPGSNTFRAKYRVSGGTGSFQDRRIEVIPF